MVLLNKTVKVNSVVCNKYIMYYNKFLQRAPIFHFQELFNDI